MAFARSSQAALFNAAGEELGCTGSNLKDFGAPGGPRFEFVLGPFRHLIRQLRLLRATRHSKKEQLREVIMPLLPEANIVGSKLSFSKEIAA